MRKIIRISNVGQCPKNWVKIVEALGCKVLFFPELASFKKLSVCFRQQKCLMNADIFDRPSSPCPVCHQMGGLRSLTIVDGLLTCPYCRQRLVVSVSGHYVRDPFAFRQRVTSQMLRRQSRPIARILRDSGISKHSSLLALLGSLLFFGFTMAALNEVSHQRFPLQDKLEQIVKLGDSE